MRFWPAAFLSAVALLAKPLLADPFIVTGPSVTGATVRGGFQITVPPVSARVAPSAFDVTGPGVTAKTLGSGFSVTTPPMRVLAQRNRFLITLDRVSAQSRTRGFTLTLPPVTATALRTSDQPQEPDATNEDTPVCEALRACFSDADIRQIEKDLISYGYTPQTYGRFCQDVAQSLGPCTAAPDTDVYAPTAPGLAGVVEKRLGETPELSSMSRCQPFEDYMQALQNRSDAGEDVTAEAERLHLTMQSSQNLLLQGRSDLWCAAITKGLN